MRRCLRGISDNASRKKFPSQPQSVDSDKLEDLVRHASRSRRRAGSSRRARHGRRMYSVVEEVLPGTTTVVLCCGLIHKLPTTSEHQPINSSNPKQSPSSPPKQVVPLNQQDHSPSTARIIAPLHIAPLPSAAPGSGIGVSPLYILCWGSGAFCQSWGRGSRRRTSLLRGSSLGGGGRARICGDRSWEGLGGCGRGRVKMGGEAGALLAWAMVVWVSVGTRTWVASCLLIVSRRWRHR